MVSQEETSRKALEDLIHDIYQGLYILKGTEHYAKDLIEFFKERPELLED